MAYRSISRLRANVSHKLIALGCLASMAACGQDSSGLAYPATRHDAMVEAPPGETWAMQWVIPVRWAKSLAMEAGSGEVIHHAKSTAFTDGRERTDHVRLCGVQLPSYRLRAYLGDEAYAPLYPPALFDAQTLPTHTMVTHLQDAGVFVADPVALQLGIAMDDPERTPWPGHNLPLPGEVVEQADGSPGFATNMRTDANFFAPPVNMSRTKRAHTFHVAMRHLVGASGALAHEHFGEGRVKVAGIGGKAALNVRVLGCQLNDGAACTPGELATINGFSPTYMVTGEGRFVMQRVAADTPCEAIRTMTFAP